MGLFSFLKPTKPVGFTYHARFSDEKTGRKMKYYDKDKDSLMERLREVREKANNNDPESRKDRIRRQLGRQNSLRTDRQYRQQKVLRSNILLMVIILGLIAVTFVVLDLYLPRILEFLGE